jgi:hypothetical protein
MALLPALATAIVTTPRGATEAYQKLQILTLMHSWPEWTATSGVVGECSPVPP